MKKFFAVAAIIIQQSTGRTTDRPSTEEDSSKTLDNVVIIGYQVSDKTKQHR